MEGEEDRISRLPDNLIHEILYFVDMKCAVQTSVLSKRWENVWKALPYITLTCASFLKDEERIQKKFDRFQDRFMGFLDKVFDSHDDSDIQMLKLKLLVLNDALAEALNRWILSAVGHNVQEIEIIVGYYDLKSSYEIPHQLLNCRSLKSLGMMLSGRPSRIDIILSKSISLPQIKTLQLNGISISNSELQRLFSSCPLMERVIIKECNIQTSNTRNIIVESHSIQTLALVNNRQTHLGPVNQPLTYTTKISAPNAKLFMCTGFMTEDFSLENLSSIISADLKMRLRGEEEVETAKTYSDVPAQEKEVSARRMMKLIGAVQSVHYLTLSAGFLEVLLQAPATLYLRPPQLCNLKTLNLEMRFTRGCLRSIAYLLKISPIIANLKLKSKEPNLADVGDDWEAGFSLTCKFSHLKGVMIKEVEGCDNELKFLRFLLGNSLVLEHLVLIFRSTSGSLDIERHK